MDCTRGKRKSHGNSGVRNGATKPPAAVRAVNSLQDWALGEEDPEMANQIIGEMKTLLKGYLAVYMNSTTDGQE